jgi:hypothetical protein
MPAIRSTVNRSIWKTVVNRPKSRASARAVPVIRQLAEIRECLSPFHGNLATAMLSFVKPFSGPAILRAAALVEAKQWKFSPAPPDGQPTTMHLAVTLRSREQ